MSNIDLFSGKDKTEISIQRLKDFEPKEGYITRSSRGRCLCESQELRQGCGGYQPSQDKFCPAMCTNLDRTDLSTCHFGEEKQCCA